jgi:hypothetical protein
MENKIYEPTDTFDFTKLSLTTPILSHGNYYIKYSINGNDLLYIQPPKCITKQGIIKSGKKMYCDLVFLNIDDKFIQWIEHLEKYSQEIIFKNREKWFESQLELTDIENSFSSSLKIYKSGKQYILRTNVPCYLGKCSLNVFNEDETTFDTNNFKETTNVISILEVQGIKCSPKNFQIDFELKQMMVLKPSILFNKCLITTGNNHQNIKEEQQQHDQPEEEQRDQHQEEQNQQQEEQHDQHQEKGQSQEEYNIKEQNEKHKELYLEQQLTETIVKVKEEKEEEVEEQHNVEEIEKIEEVKPIQPYLGDYEIIDQTQLTEEEDDNMIEEIDFNLEFNTTDDPPIHLKDKSDVYYEIYKDAFEKAKENRILAISKFFKKNSIENIDLLINTLQQDENI